MKRKAKITIRDRFSSTGVGYWWSLYGANGEIICHSEQYASRSNALRAARRAKQLMAEAEVK